MLALCDEIKEELKELKIVKLQKIDGGIYTGLSNGEHRTGFGVFVTEDGSKYDGMWKNDKRHGTGR